MELDNNPDLKREVSYTISIKSETRNARKPDASVKKIYEYCGPDIDTIVLLNSCGNKWAAEPWTFKDGPLKEVTTASRSEARQTIVSSHPEAWQTTTPNHPRTGQLTIPNHPEALQTTSPIHPGTWQLTTLNHPEALQTTTSIHPGTWQLTTPNHPEALQTTTSIHPGTWQLTTLSHPVVNDPVSYAALQCILSEKQGA